MRWTRRNSKFCPLSRIRSLIFTVAFMTEEFCSLIRYALRKPWRIRSSEVSNQHGHQALKLRWAISHNHTNEASGTELNHHGPPEEPGDMRDA
ncbi:hypothetical protein NDU88_007300 [Pleurodeles waltl]|uniref:Uncharacterized protein n=1 Tax=Pleurodeles waltl TaxID=8319 RepID=A0AAV7USH8_PLEWA|nr:hypothetical protein NDU88_007300 [Pleurodeles waltl]